MRSISADSSGAGHWHGQQIRLMLDRGHQVEQHTIDAECFGERDPLPNLLEAAEQKPVSRVS